MMPLSIMWQVDQAITAEGHNPVATALAAPWRPDAPPLFFRSSANFVYTFRREGQPCFLRFSPRPYARSHPAVRAELAAMSRASEHGIPTPQPLPSLEGRAVHVLRLRRTTYVVVAFSALLGDEVEVDEIDCERCRAWGSLVARLQCALNRPALPEAVARDSWRRQSSRIARQLVSAPVVVQAELAELRAALGSWRPGSGYGLVHLDVELDNMRWVGAAPGVLDFDECARSWYALDVASALRDLDHRPELREAFLQGYEAEGREPVRERLDLARRWLDLAAYATVDRSLDLEPTDDHPGWLTSLRSRLVARQTAYVAALARR